MRNVVENPLDAGREAVARHAWDEAYKLLAAADADAPLAADDLELLAQAAVWSGRVNAAVEAYERAYAGYVERGDAVRAASTAIRLAVEHRNRSANALAAGWHGRAARLLESEPETAVHGYLAHQKATIALARGDVDEALELARRAVELGTRFGDRDLEALGLLRQGVALLKKGDLEEGLALLDEASAAAIGGALTPPVTGAIYCATIDSCRELADYARAQEWTETATRWCERQSIAGFPGVCRVDRAEIMRFKGDLAHAEREAMLACEELRDWPRVAGAAFAEVGAVRLRRGDLQGADEAFSRADELGRDPEPGRSLLRLAEGKIDAAVASITRALDDASRSPLTRARVLPAFVEIEIRARDLRRAAEAADDLDGIARVYKTPAFEASAAQARGAVQLAEGDPEGALQPLRHARRLWQDVCGPYEAAKTRILIGEAYRALGDEDGATAEFRVAKEAFERLGAALDVRRAAELLGELSSTRTFAFTDIVDSTKMAEAIGEQKWRKLLRWHDRTVRQLIENNGGEVIKSTGDGFFAAFEGPGPAIDAAVEIQRALDSYDGVAPDVRIGLHSGTAFARDGDDFGGQAVHTAARIAALAGPSEIVASRETLLDGASRFRTSAPRSVELKGLSQPVEIVSIEWR